MEIRDAVKADARQLAYLINLAGEGLPEYLWRSMTADGESSMDVGAGRAAREEGGFSYTNARVCVEDGTLIAMMLSYRQPDPYLIGDLAAYPDIVRPLVELEARAPGSWYINAVATCEAHRGRGAAQMLNRDAECRARTAGCDQLSLIVASENAGARRLYDHMGFRDTSTLPVVPYPGCLHGGHWVLMVRPVGAV